MSHRHRTLTDAELAAFDIPQLLRTGLPARPELFAEGIIAAGIAAGALEVLPRSLTYLAEIVRRGGVAYAAALPEPLPTPDSAALARTWLTAAAEVTDVPDLELGEAMARWLDGVAAVVTARRSPTS